MLIFTLLPVTIIASLVTSLDQIFPRCNDKDLAPDNLRKWRNNVAECGLLASIRGNPAPYVGTTEHPVPDYPTMVKVSHHYKEEASGKTAELSLLFYKSTGEVLSAKVDTLGLRVNNYYPKEW